MNLIKKEFDSNVLDLTKEKGFYSYEHMSDFEKFKEKLPSKEKLYSLLTDIVTKSMNMFFKYGIDLK